MIQAVEHVRPMRGGAQSHLIRADDGHHYVVKFLNNPQHPRVLANEWLASGIARSLGLAVPRFAAIDVPPQLIAASPGLTIRFGGRNVPVQAGPAFGSRVPTADPTIPVYDSLPENRLTTVDNLADFAGVLAFDKWVCNCDGRQVIFCRPARRRGLRVFFIDHGFAFNAGDWTFPDNRLRALYIRRVVYAHVRSWSDFEPWLSRIERYPLSRLKHIAYAMPSAWLGPEDKIDELIDVLVGRRQHVRALLDAVLTGPGTPFDHWGRPAPALTINSQPLQQGEAA